MASRRLATSWKEAWPPDCFSTATLLDNPPSVAYGDTILVLAEGKSVEVRYARKIEQIVSMGNES